ncbi:MAG: hypothetical protein KIT15_05120 [Xanthobacteraceae bacterium]|nr:hypothetical protein [Xanthobacteraceae bacterium]MCW5678247.1 hypothetical protein [Xanthobacteraceae bacterium]
MSFNELQEIKNGPLKAKVRERISAFRAHYTLAEIGEALGFSGPFVSQLLRDKNPAHMDSKHCPRVVKALEKAERENAELLSTSERQPKSPIPGGAKSLDYHLAAIDALGWKITGLTRK